MIESPRALRIPVPDLALATRWYTQAFDLEPTQAHADGVTFHVPGCAVLLVPGQANPEGPVVYWGVQDVAGEQMRLTAIHGASNHALPAVQSDCTEAIVHDPFGNPFGLTSLADSDIRRARNQRSAEKIALRNVRETLDGLQQDEQAKRQSLRVFLIAGLVVAMFLLGAVLFSSHRAKSMASDKPLTIPRLERP